MFSCARKCARLYTTPICLMCNTQRPKGPLGYTRGDHGGRCAVHRRQKKLFAPRRICREHHIAWCANECKSALWRTLTLTLCSCQTRCKIGTNGERSELTNSRVAKRALCPVVCTSSLSEGAATICVSATSKVTDTVGAFMRRESRLGSHAGDQFGLRDSHEPYDGITVEAIPHQIVSS